MLSSLSSSSINLIRGKALEIQLIYEFLNNSYTPSQQQAVEIDGFARDDELSDDRVQVYFNPSNSQTVVIHRGTDKYNIWEWVYNLAYYFEIYEFTSRFKHGKNIQCLAEVKYGARNIYTLGHSTGAMIAEKVGKKTHSVISLNRPVTLKDALLYTTARNHYDIRASIDLPSIIQIFQRKINHACTVCSKSFSIVEAHSYERIKELGAKVRIGKDTLVLRREKNK